MEYEVVQYIVNLLATLDPKQGTVSPANFVWTGRIYGSVIYYKNFKLFIAMIPGRPCPTLIIKLTPSGTLELTTLLEFPLTAHLYKAQLNLLIGGCVMLEYVDKLE
jgi:hypothetical protein